jgi:hypothetical protein
MKKLINVITIISIFFISLTANHNEANSKTSAYLIGSYIDVEHAKKIINDMGYEILTTYKSVKNGHTIVFTNNTLKKQASKKNRGYMAVLRLFVDDKEKMISITNPVYFGKAFMQEDYNHEIFNNELKSIKSGFKNLTNSKDSLDSDTISHYHFMPGMPYYEDYEELAKGSNSELIKKIQNYKNAKAILFKLKLSDKSTLIGYDLSKRTKKFVKKIGRENASVLPYCILIEDGVAKALAAKYYLALSYPLLSITKFTKIATVPGAILRDIKRPFR